MSFLNFPIPPVVFVLHICDVTMESRVLRRDDVGNTSGGVSPETPGLSSNGPAAETSLLGQQVALRGAAPHGAPHAGDSSLGPGHLQSGCS